jgi:hypothetical protein
VRGRVRVVALTGAEEREREAVEMEVEVKVEVEVEVEDEEATREEMSPVEIEFAA